MKIRRLADAAIVAALLLASIPDLDPEQTLTPEVLLTPPPVATPADPPADDNPAARPLS